MAVAFLFCGKNPIIGKAYIGLRLEKEIDALKSSIRTLTDYIAPKLDKSPPHGKMFTFYSQEGCFVKSYVYGFSYLYGSERRTTKR